MKIKSIQFKFLMTVISAMLAITIFIGGISIYEVDNFVQSQTKNLINATCEKEVSQINDDFGDMEKSVHIMESYVYDFIKSWDDIVDPEKQLEILDCSNDMFVDVAKHTDSAVSYYLRFSPEVSHGTGGFFYSKGNQNEDFVRLETTDLTKYAEDDTEHVGWYWQAKNAGKPVWLSPYYNMNSGILMISYVVPLYYNNEFFGVVGMDFDYTLLTQKVHNIKIYENGFAHLEFDGADIYNADHIEDVKLHEHPEEYLSVSNKLENGMELVISASYKDIRQMRYNIELKILFVVILLAVLFSLIVFFVVKRIVLPLKNLTDASIKLSNGDYDVEIIHSDTYEIKMLSTVFENMAQNLKEHERLQQVLAYRDSLTGLRNTNSYKQWLSDFEKEMETEKVDFGVIMLDINYLKETNDKYGHDAGNKLITAAAQIISGTFKRSPAFRIGGDEFLVILQNRDLEKYETLLRKFDTECKNESVVIDEAVIPVRIAKGFARFDANKDSKFMDVFNRADDAMYENKRELKGLK